MKSIKDKAKKWCSEHSNKGCTEQCDGCWQLKQAWGCEQHNMETAYEAGANYVLERIEHACMKGVYPREKYDSVLDTIKQLRSNQ